MYCPSHWPRADGRRASGQLGRWLLVRTPVESASKQPVQNSVSFFHLHGVAPVGMAGVDPKKMPNERGVEQAVAETLCG